MKRAPAQIRIVRRNTGVRKGTGNGHREASIAAIDSYCEWRSIYIDYSHRLQRAQIDIDIPI